MLLCPLFLLESQLRSDDCISRGNSRAGFTLHRKSISISLHAKDLNNIIFDFDWVKQQAHDCVILSLCRLLIHAVRQTGSATKIDKASWADRVISRFVNMGPCFHSELFNLFNRDKACVASKISFRGGKSSATIGAGILQQFRDKVKDQEKQTNKFWEDLRAIALVRDVLLILRLKTEISRKLRF